MDKTSDQVDALLDAYLASPQKLKTLAQEFRDDEIIQLVNNYIH